MHLQVLRLRLLIPSTRLWITSITMFHDRSQRREKRDPKEIGISAVRGGSIVGEHEVLFCGQDEVIEFKHTAYSKAVFAKGAVEAAKFLKGKGAGHYDMKRMLLQLSRFRPFIIVAIGRA